MPQTAFVPEFCSILSEHLVAMSTSLLQPLFIPALDADQSCSFKS